MGFRVVVDDPISETLRLVSDNCSHGERNVRGLESNDTVHGEQKSFTDKRVYQDLSGPDGITSGWAVTRERTQAAYWRQLL